MSLIDKLAERHIRRAMDNGEFDDLPGHGQPQQLDDDSLVPKELRAGYRLLKNAGYLPPEMQFLKELRDVESLLRAADCGDEQQKYQRRLDYLRSQLMVTRGGSGLLAEVDYQNKLRKKIER